MADNKLTTNFNTSPYYDDFDPEKKFYRIIFRPEMAVQARELTQIQSIIQNQITKYGEHVFKEGSLVTGGKIVHDSNVNFVKIKDLDSLGNPINLTELIGATLTSNTTGVKAQVVNYSNGSESGTDKKTLFLKYTSSSTVNGTDKTFIANELITSSTGISFNSLSGSGIVGKSFSFSIGRGVIFSKGLFVLFDDQSIIVDKSSNTPSARIGFDVQESIINSDLDYSLLDPANGAPNFAAPGADRLEVNPVLSVIGLEEIPSPDFVELMKIDAGVVYSIFDKPQYAVIRDEFARRTYDESGNYAVKGLQIKMREHLNDGSNLGYLTIGNGGNSSVLAVGVDAGKAYVHGYEIEKIVTEYVSVDKGIDIKSISDQNISANYGNFVYVKEMAGAWNVNSGIVIDLYNAVSTAVTSNNYSTTTPAGSKIGTAVFKTIEYDSGTIGTPTCVYKLYLTNIKMTSGSFSSVKSFYYNDATYSDCFADIVGTTAILQEKNFNTHIFEIPTQNIQKIRDASNNVDASFIFKKKFDVSVATTGLFSINTGDANETFPFSNGFLNSTQKRENFVMVLNSAANVSITGTVGTTSGSPTVTGSGTTFLTKLNIGDVITVNSETKKITAIGSNTSLTVDSNFGTTGSGYTLSRSFKVGEIIDLDNFGTTGVNKTIEVTSSTTVNFDLKTTFASTLSASIIVNLTKSSAREKAKVMRRNRFVILQLSTNPGTTNGPWNLGIPDVYRIVSVRKKTGAFTTDSEGVDVTNNFILDNGQRDDSYDYSKLRKKVSGYSLSSGEYLLVKLDYFEHDTSQGNGFFSVDSYPIDDINGAANTAAITTPEIPIYKSPTTGMEYNLRDCVDIRPKKQLMANDATTVGTASINPTESVDFSYPVGGLNTFTPNESMNISYSYYLPRKDLVCLTKDGRIQVVRGIPSQTPSTPTPLVESMALAEISIAPYPSLPPEIAVKKQRLQYSNKIRNMAIKRYTMQDIGALEKRISNIEYYTSLNFLEKETLDTKVLDSNGLDRFKNGILVDPFKDHGIGDLNDPSYTVSIDRKKTEMRPSFKLSDVDAVFLSTTGLTKTGNLITLPFTETLMINQPYASTARNAAGMFYTYSGDLTLYPDQDYWTDTVNVPDLQITDNSDFSNWQTLANAWDTEWGAWQTILTGTPTVTNTNRGTTTTTTTTQQAIGTDLVINGNSTNTQSYGTSVVDVSVIPYIRSKEIKFFASGMKPNTRLWARFDGEDVNDYISPSTSAWVPTAARGSELKTDSTGNVYGLFFIPNNPEMRFRSGEKAFRLSDSITDETDNGLVTTYAQATYVASGINQSKQNTIVSTVTPILSVVTNTQTQTLTTTSSTQVVQPTPPWFRGGTNDSPDPIAQSFTVLVKNQASGAFITSMDLYFASKHPTLGALIEIRELDSSGYLTKKIVPYSIKRIPSASINVSNDSSVATHVAFDAPIYLLANVDYAFVVKPESMNDQTTLWVSKLGGDDILTNAKIVKQPFGGSLFASSNDKTWEPIQDEDIKFKINVAQFTVGTGTVNFKNEPEEYLTLTSSSGIMDIGERIKGESRITLGSIVGGTIVVGNKVQGSTSGAIGTVSYISGSSMRVKTVSINLDFTIGETLTFYDGSMVATGVSSSVSANVVLNGVVTGFTSDEANVIKMNVKRLDNLTVSMLVGETLTSQINNYDAVISTFDNRLIHVSNLQSSQLVFPGTSVNWKSQFSTNNTLDGTVYPVELGVDEILQTEKNVLSRTNELANSLTNGSLKMQAVLQTTNAFVSPVVDVSRTHNMIIENIINNDSTDEDDKAGGNALVRYISKKVTLADGQDSEDLKVFVTGYRPYGSDIKVYYKVLNSGDGDIFEDISWKEMENNSPYLFSDIEKLEDFKEIEYSIPAAHKTGSNGEVQYTNTESVVFTGYKYFAIKIVLLSAIKTRIPRCRDYRAICLMM